MEKKMVRDDNRCSRVGSLQSGKAPQKRFVTKPLVKGGAVPSGPELTKTKTSHHYRPGTRALMEIRHFQKSTDLLIQKKPFYRLVREVLQAEKLWFKLEASAVMALHEASEAYFIQLL